MFLLKFIRINMNGYKQDKNVLLNDWGYTDITSTV